MGKPIEVTRREMSATELRELAAKTRDGVVVRRLLGIAMILDGHCREEAAGHVIYERRARTAAAFVRRVESRAAVRDARRR